MNINNVATINPRHSPEMYDRYCAAKDLRMSARQKEKRGDMSPVVIGQWRTINQQTVELFASGCADLELCSWHAEALLRLDGFVGLEQALRFICKLVQTHGSDLSSVELASDMPQYWIAPITELSGEGGEGVLIQPLRLCPLIPQSCYGERSLWHYQNSIQAREGEAYRALVQSIGDVGSSAMYAQRETIRACIVTYEAMLVQFDSLLPAYPPARTNLLAVLQECVRAINDLSGFNEADTPTQQNLHDAATPRALLTNLSVTPSHSKITDREQALKLLSDVALFFRLQEPQSPIAPALETLIRRGRLPFDALLEDLLSDADARRTILVSAGIHAANFDDR